MPDNKYYDLLRQQSYKELLNSEVQASAAKQNALKYTQQQLQAGGYGNQGMAESTRLGAYNNYQNALANAQSNYNSQMMDINKQQLQDQETNKNTFLNVLMNYMNSSGNANEYDNTSKQGLDSTLNRAGIFVNDDNTLNFDKATQNYSEDDKYNLQEYYNSLLRNSQPTWDSNTSNQVVAQSAQQDQELVNSGNLPSASNNYMFKPANNSDITIDAKNIFNTNGEIETNKNFKMNVGGKDYNVEIGDIATKFWKEDYNKYKGMTVSQYQEALNNHKNGEVWVEKNDGKNANKDKPYTAYIKLNNEIRIIENVGTNKNSTFKELLEKLAENK